MRTAGRFGENFIFSAVLFCHFDRNMYFCRGNELFNALNNQDMKIPQHRNEVTEAFADEWFVGLPIRPLRNMDAKNTRQHLAAKLLGNKDADPMDITKAWLALTPEKKCSVCWHMTGHHEAAFVEDIDKPSYT